MVNYMIGNASGEVITNLRTGPVFDPDIHPVGAYVQLLYDPARGATLVRTTLDVSLPFAARALATEVSLTATFPDNNLEPFMSHFNVRKGFDVMVGDSLDYRTIASAARFETGLVRDRTSLSQPSG